MADNTGSFGIQQSSGAKFPVNAGSNETILQHTEDSMQIQEGRKSRICTDTGLPLLNGIQEGNSLAPIQLSFVSLDVMEYNGMK